MQASAIDRALLHETNVETTTPPPPPPWNTIRRIIRRQTSPQTLQTSLERIVEEPDLPLELLNFALDRISDHTDTSHVLIRCIRNIWRRVLIDRTTPAFHVHLNHGTTTTTSATSNRFIATWEFQQELLNIQSRHDLFQNILILKAWEKTKRLIQRLQDTVALLQQQEHTNDTSLLLPNPSFRVSPTPLVQAMVQQNLPPFLFLLAFREDPNCLSFRRNDVEGCLPLHVAAEAEYLLCRNHSNDHHYFCGASSSLSSVLALNMTTGRILFQEEKQRQQQQQDDEENQQQQQQHPTIESQKRNKLVTLLNHPHSIIPLLCFLCPRAGVQATYPQHLPTFASSLLEEDDQGSINNIMGISSSLSQSLSSSSSTSEYRRGFIPLEYFLYSLQKVAYNNKPKCQHHNITWSHSKMEQIFNTIRPMVRIAPMALETRHPQTKWWPFLIPMTVWDAMGSNNGGGGNGGGGGRGRRTLEDEDDDDNEQRRPPQRMYYCTYNQYDKETSAGQKFLLTLTFELLRANPVVLRHCRNNTHTATKKEEEEQQREHLQPRTKYEQILKERIHREDTTIRKWQNQRDEWERQIAILKEQNQQLLQQQNTGRMTLHDRPNKRRKKQ